MVTCLSAWVYVYKSRQGNIPYICTTAPTVAVAYVTRSAALHTITPVCVASQTPQGKRGSCPPPILSGSSCLFVVDRPEFRVHSVCDHLFGNSLSLGLQYLCLPLQALFWSCPTRAASASQSVGSCDVPCVLQRPPHYTFPRSQRAPGISGSLHTALICWSPSFRVPRHEATTESLSPG